MDKKLLGNRIKIARKSIGFTGEQLAEALNINATYLRQIEAGLKTPSLPMFVDICNKVNASPNYLLGDSIENSSIDGIDILIDLWKKANPEQIRLITALVESALNSLQD